MTRLHRLAFLAAVLVAAGLAYSQSTLGNMFKLGGSTTANLPASSSFTTGALIFDLDAGAPKYNDGTAWQSFGGGGASFWYDGGAGFIQAAETLGVATAATPVNIARAVVTTNGQLISSPTLGIESSYSSPNSPAIRANHTFNPGYGGNRGSEVQLGYNGAYATQIGGWYSTAESIYVTGVCTNQSNPPYSGSSIRFAIGDPGGNACGDTTFNLNSGNVRFNINDSDVISYRPLGLAAYNDAGIPTATGRTGAIAYNTSQGAPVWSDGTSWQSFGGGGSGGGSNYWLDGGTYYATNTVSLLPQGDGGQTFWYTGNLVEAQPIVAYNPKTTFGSLTGGFVMAHPNTYPVGFAMTTDPTLGFDMSAQYGLWFSPGSGLYYNGATPWTEFSQGLNIGSSSATVTAQPTSFIGLAANTGGKSARFAYMHNSTTLQGLHVGGQYADSSGKNGVEFEYNTTRLDLGTGSTDYLFSDGVDTVTAGGILIGNTGTRIASTPACTTTSSGGALAANTCEQIRGITCSPATTGSPCAVGVPGGTSNKSTLVTQCWVSDTDVVALNICNVGTVSITPPAQTYTVRVFNQ